MTWNMAGKLKNVKNEKCSLQDLQYGKKTDQKVKLETHMAGPGIWQEALKNLQNEKHTLQELDSVEKTEKLGKCDTHTVRPGIWRELRKTRKMRNSHVRT